MYTKPKLDVLEIDQSRDVAAAVAHRSPDVRTVVVVGARSRRTAVIGALTADLLAVLPSARVVEVISPVPCLESLPEVGYIGQVVAVGGGKVMDVGKLLALCLNREEIAARLAANQTAIPRRARLVCIPTTAGSGSEATHFAVCYHRQIKYSIAHPSIRPDLAALCPALLRDLPRRQMAISGLDAVAQAIESLFSDGANAESTAHARIAMTAGLTALRALADDVSLPETRMCLQRAAHSAGKAIDIAKTNLPHALSYHLTMRHGVPHGLAVAMFFEAYLRLIDLARAEMTAERQEDARRVFHSLGGHDRYVQGRWTELLSDLGLPGSITHLGAEVDLNALASSVNLERLRNLTIPFDLDEFIAEAIGIVSGLPSDATSVHAQRHNGEHAQ